jgi:hypothetical protein
MSTIKFDRRCANCGREPLAIGMPVFRNSAVQGQGSGDGGVSVVDTAIWCIDCVRQLLHQEGEDEVVVGG